MICAFITAAAGIVASRVIFASFLLSLLRRPMSVFEQSLSGVVLNLVAEDTAELDYVVHFTLRSMLMVVLSAAGTAAVIVSVTPWAGVAMLLSVPGYAAVQVQKSKPEGS